MRIFEALENYARANQGEKLTVAILNPAEIDRTRQRMASVAGVRKSSDFPTIVEAVESRSQIIDWATFNMAAGSSSISSLMQKLELNPDAEVNILWPSAGRGEIHRMSQDDLSALFDYTWRPNVDRVVIFDDRMSLLVSINSSGGIHFMDRRGLQHAGEQHDG